MYEFWDSVMTCLTSYQPFDVYPKPFGIKGHVVDFLSEATRPSCFRYVHCFVDLLLECFQVEKCSRGWGIITGSNDMEHQVSGFKGGCECVTTEVEPPLVLPVIDHRCLLATAKNGFIKLGVVEWFSKSVP